MRPALVCLVNQGHVVRPVPRRAGIPVLHMLIANGVWDVVVREDVSAVQGDVVLPRDPPDEIGRALIELLGVVTRRRDRKADVLDPEPELVVPEIIDLLGPILVRDELRLANIRGDARTECRLNFGLNCSEQSAD